MPYTIFRIRKEGEVLIGYSRAGKYRRWARIAPGFPFRFWLLAAVTLYNNTANLTGAAIKSNSPVTGGVQYLNPDAFSRAAPGVLGVLGRNGIAGPGFYSIDLALARSFRFPRLGERGRIEIRSDWFNFLNHSNLNNPVSFVGLPNFGVASFGRVSLPPDSLLATPVDESSRQRLLHLKLEF